MTKTLLLMALLMTVAPASAENSEPELVTHDIAPLVEIQWFDAEGHVVKLDWKTHTKWAWKESKLPSGVDPKLQVWVQLPEQLKIVKSLTPSVRIMDRGRKLVIEMDEATMNGQLELQAAKGTGVEKVGLLVGARLASPQLVVHESCSKAGVSLQPHEENQGAPGGDELLYLGASCLVSGESVVVRYHAAPDCELLNEAGAAITSSTVKLNPGRQDIEDLQLRSSKTGAAFSYTLRVGSGHGVPAPAAVAEAASATKDLSPSMDSPVVAVGFSGTTLSYSAPRKPYAPVQLNVEPHITVRRSLWRAELRVPLLQLLPRPFSMPASGVYSLSGRITPQVLAWGGAPRWALQPGVHAVVTHFEHRKEASFFALGPALALTMSMAERLHASLSVTPLLGPGRDSAYRGTGINAQLSTPLGAPGRHPMELVIRGDYYRLDGSSESDVDYGSLGLGIAIWL